MNPQAGVYRRVHDVLYVGMIASTAFYVVGIVVALVRGGRVPLDPAWIRERYHVAAIEHGIVTLDPVVLMMIATALLILTPVVRVGVSIYAFARAGDRKFVGVTCVVALVMVATLVLARVGLR